MTQILSLIITNLAQRAFFLSTKLLEGQLLCRTQTMFFERCSFLLLSLAIQWEQPQKGSLLAFY